MSFVEALVHAHSDETNEPTLVADILYLLDVWEKIESLSSGSAQQLKCISHARSLVDDLRANWHLSNEEIMELDEHAVEFRQWFEPTNSPQHRAVS